MFATEGRRYLDERILKARVGLIWLLVLAGVLLTTADPLARLPWLALASAMFILAFRLWDDLADLEYDRRYHPQRGLARSANLQPFHLAQWSLLAGLAGLLPFLAGGGRALAFLGLVISFFAMYRATGKRPALRPLRVTLVLAKYPAFVLLMAHRPGEHTSLLIALGAYLPPLLDEARSTGSGILLPAAAFVGLAILTWLGLTT